MIRLLLRRACSDPRSGPEVTLVDREIHRAGSLRRRTSATHAGHSSHARHCAHAGTAGVRYGNWHCSGSGHGRRGDRGNQLVRSQESSGPLHAVKVHGRAGCKAAPIDR